MPTSLPRSQESNRYYNMVTTLVFPAFVEKFKHMRVREVTMQQDGARCHTCKKKDGLEASMTQKLNAAGAKLRPRIKVVTQPAQSPDVNICDLAFFRALACALRKRRRVASGASRTALFDLDKLAADSHHAAFNDYSSETLEEMWAYKTIIMDRIIESKGGNDYMTVVARPKSARAESGPEGSRYSWRGRYI